MKKKLTIVAMATAMALSVVACGDKSTTIETVVSTETQTESAIETTVETETKETTSNKDLPDGDYTDMGEGTMYIINESGTSENGNVPVIFNDGDILIMQIGLNTEGFDGSKLSFIYIDGMLAAKEQLGDSQVTIDLQDDALSEGTHKVEVVQYDTDQADSQMVTYKNASYEVKAK